MQQTLLVRSNRFWQVNAYPNHTVAIHFGAKKYRGRRIFRFFTDAASVEDYVQTAVEKKLQEGFVKSKPLVGIATRGAVRKRELEDAENAAQAAKKLRRSPRRASSAKLRLRAGAQRGILDVHAPFDGEIVVLDDSGPCDVMLVEVDTARKVDNFIVLQLIKTDIPKTPYIVYKRWGATGLNGTTWYQDYKNIASAVTIFSCIFNEFTGTNWGDEPELTPARNDDRIAGRYNVLARDYGARLAANRGNEGKWMYWVDDFVDGKPVGWYPYDIGGNAVAEKLFQESLLNSNYSQRLIKSGCFSYLVDLQSKTQTNVSHYANKVRHIRRQSPGVEHDLTPPEAGPYAEDFVIDSEGSNDSDIYSDDD